MRLPLLLLFTVLFFAFTAPAQNIVRGVVKDNAQFPIPGAIVGIKGTSSGAVTDSAGVFSITAPDKFPFFLLINNLGSTLKEIEIYEIPEEDLEVTLYPDNMLAEVTVTSRRRAEPAQNIPIPITVVGGPLIEDAGAFNVNRLKELVPSVQLYSSNPRNTTLNIRGLGSTFGLTNDGIDPGVGFYVDGVYFARPAATTLDFIDIEQIEVLRGPQGTLFGKNTTAGAFNITTRRPSFTPKVGFELSYGNYGYIQAKSSITGPLFKNKLAGRLSFSGTQRDGVIENVATGQFINDINNLGVRGQLLFTPVDKINIILAADGSRQRPNGYAQVVAGVAPTLRAPYRQFNQIIADLNYQLPSTNPFDRKVDTDTPWRSGNDHGGVSLTADFKIGPGTLTSTSAWRFWNWDPSNDRDFTGLSVLRLSQATSKHQQASQEIRYAGRLSSRISGVVGVFAIDQNLITDPVHIEESGRAQWRFSQSTTSARWNTPGLFDGYGISTKSTLNTLSAAVFGQLDLEVIKGLHLLPGVRYNYDQKEIDYKRTTYGGLQTTDPELIALKRLVYTDQSFAANIDNTNFSGNLTLSFRASDRFNTFATYAKSFKPVGINLGGLPTVDGKPALDLATVKPEEVNHFEFGIKSKPLLRTTLNLTVYNTEIENFQTQVQTAELGVNRGYLANAQQVRVRGLELDANLAFTRHLAFYGGLSYTEGKYVSFTNAPLPLEETGATVSFKDISGGDLPGISKWAGSLGGELSFNSKLMKNQGKYFIAADAYGRSSFSSSPSPSKYLNIDGYALLNARLGFRATEGLSIILWSRNLLNQNYFEQLLPAAGNAGYYAAVLGDPRTYGITLRQTF